MAANITVARARNPQTIYEATGVALANSYKTVDATNLQDERTAFLIVNASTSTDATITVEKGNGYAATVDLEMIAPKNKASVFYLESAKYKNVAGEYKDMMRIKGAADCTLYVLAVGVADEQSQPDAIV